MNTANLQLEGLYMALAALIELIKDKGLAGQDDIDAALARAEEAALADKSADLSAANLEAIGFPLRLLRLANSTSGAENPLSFNALTRRVGEAKDRRNPLSQEEILAMAKVLEQERDA